MTFYIQVSDGQFINEQFHSIQEARNFCAKHKIHGYEIVDEYQLQELRQEAQRDNRHQSFDNSIIKRAYQPHQTNMRVPVQNYQSQKAPNYVRPYQSFKPHFVRRRRKNESQTTSI